MTSLDPATLVHAQWHKSTYSTGTQCIEVATVGGLYAVRDSKNPTGGHLTFSTATWAEFIAAIKHRSPGH